MAAHRHLPQALMHDAGTDADAYRHQRLPVKALE